jgi:hypothetical protein
MTKVWRETDHPRAAHIELEEQHPPSVLSLRLLTQLMLLAHQGQDRKAAALAAGAGVGTKVLTRCRVQSGTMHLRMASSGMLG